MEEQPQAEAIQTFSRQHASGEIFEAQNIEMARGMCPVLGRLSVEEAGLLLELEAMGNQKMANTDQQEKIVEKPVIEPVKAVTDYDKKPSTKDAYDKIVEVAISVELKDDDRSKGITREAPAADMHHSFLTQQEASRAEEAIKTVAVLPATSEATAQPIDPEAVIAVDRVTFTHLVKTVREEDFGDVQLEAVPLSPYEQFYKGTKEQSEPELDLISLSAATEPIEAQEGLADYNLFEEDDVILLTAEPEQSEAVLNESGEPALPAVVRFTPAEFQAVISVPEFPAPLGEIETTITQLVEALELVRADESQKVYQILEEIIALPNNLKAITGESTEIVQERLEELFIKLFDETDIKYTPELIKSFIKLTEAHYLNELLETVKEEAPLLPNEIGTREFLQKLQHSLSGMKQAVIHFYKIGKSALRLYSLNRAGSYTH